MKKHHQPQSLILGHDAAYWRKKLHGKPLGDDLFFRVALHQNPDVARVIIATILNRKDFSLLSLRVHPRLPAFLAILRFADGTLFQIELQSYKEKATKRKIVYDQSLFESENLVKSVECHSYLHRIAIFLIDWDYGNSKRPLYHIRNCIMEEKTEFGDGKEIIIANTKITSSAATIGRLMNDLSATEAKSIHDLTLRGVYEITKKDGVHPHVDEEICRFFEGAEPGLVEEWKNQGAEIGRQEGKYQTILGLFKKGVLPEKTAAESLGLSVERFRKVHAKARSQ